ncbi:hypothetical protein NDU88_005256 [Pleurodeles waltl]|uniref:Uncharacterized protein n=1 Tax=Pleurodeles waltl TaxID=8319 RepID=A0AAV7RHZ6_PLEWA|nr:hypothetical protein NDU88_005256 [Pleurodeles waltl]
MCRRPAVNRIGSDGLLSMIYIDRTDEEEDVARIERYELNSMSIINKKLINLPKELMRLTGVTSQQKNYAILNNIIDNYEADIIQRKNRKFRRDLRDYQQGRVYTFSKKYDNVQDSNPPVDTHSCPDTIPSSEVETSDDSDKDSSTRPRVNFLEEARRFRLGSLQETRTKLPDTSTVTPGTSGIQTRARSKNLRPLNTMTN